MSAGRVPVPAGPEQAPAASGGRVVVALGVDLVVVVCCFVPLLVLRASTVATGWLVLASLLPVLAVLLLASSALRSGWTPGSMLAHVRFLAVATGMPVASSAARLQVWRQLMAVDVTRADPAAGLSRPPDPLVAETHRQSVPPESIAHTVDPAPTRPMGVPESRAPSGAFGRTAPGRSTPSSPTPERPGSVQGSDATVPRNRLITSTPAAAAELIRLVFDDGTEIVPTGPTLIGRSPQAAAGEYIETFASLTDLDRTVSRTHLWVAWDGRALWVEDRGSTSGSAVEAPGGHVEGLRPGHRRAVRPGSAVRLGSRRFIIVGRGAA